jgi:hypothetical protein
MTDALTQIRTLYFRTTKATIEQDFDTAIDVLKSMATEDERDRAAVYMEGLAQMKSQWAAGGRPARPLRGEMPSPGPPKASSSPRAAKGPPRSGRSKGGGRRPR